VYGHGLVGLLLERLHKSLSVFVRGVSASVDYETPGL